jgi:BASS family bile acid:Na+ symporter
MLGMGLSLTLKDFKRVAEKPLAISMGLILQLVVLPAIAFGIAYLLKLPDFIAVGLIILAACPGGPTSNLITHLAKGDTALSVSLTAVSSYVTILSIPFVINLGADVFMTESQQVNLDIGETIKNILVVSIVPVIIGMTINRYASAFAKKMDKPVKIASAVILIVLIVGIVVKERSNFADYFAQAGLATLLLNVISMAAGFGAAKLAKLNNRQATSLSVETGIQNGTMAITIAVGILGRADLSISAAVYSLIMFFTSGFVIFMMNKKNAQEAV